MQQFPEHEDLLCQTAALPRPSRFREQLSSTDIAISSCYECVAIHPSPESDQVPIHLIHRLRAELKQQSHVKRRMGARDITLKLRLRHERRNEFHKSICRADKAIHDLARPRDNSTMTIVSPVQRRSLAFSTIRSRRAARRTVKGQQKQQEKKGMAAFSGGMWGYDPNAGRLMKHEENCTISPCNPDDHMAGNEAGIGCYIFRGRGDGSRVSVEDGSEEIDEFGRRTGKTWV